VIYFDHNATTPLDERVLEVMSPFLTRFYANPSSIYRAGRLARSAIDTARQQVAALFSVSPAQIVFTSGGTEANNLAIKGTVARWRLAKIAVGAFEHPSVLEAASSLRQQGCRVETIAVDADGHFSMSHVEQLLETGVNLISLMLVNNETGVIQNIGDLAANLQAHDVLLHTDAVQAAGKIAVDFNRLGVNLMSVSSHKIYGPKGCGALIMDKTTDLQPLLHGGGQEQGVRAGTENVAAIVGFGKAAELALLELEQRRIYLQELSSYLRAALQCIEGLVLFGAGRPKVANTVQFGIPGTDGEMLSMQLDRKGFAVSSGSACATGGGEPSHVLMSMGIDRTLAKSALRISLGVSNKKEDIDSFIELLIALIPKFR